MQIDPGCWGKMFPSKILKDSCELREKKTKGRGTIKYKQANKLEYGWGKMCHSFNLL